jgi:hypothetical protein
LLGSSTHETEPSVRGNVSGLRGRLSIALHATAVGRCTKPSAQVTKPVTASCTGDVHGTTWPGRPPMPGDPPLLGDPALLMVPALLGDPALLMVPALLVDPAPLVGPLPPTSSFALPCVVPPHATGTMPRETSSDNLN